MRVKYLAFNLLLIRADHGSALWASEKSSTKTTLGSVSENTHLSNVDLLGLKNPSGLG